MTKKIRLLPSEFASVLAVEAAIGDEAQQRRGIATINSHPELLSRCFPGWSRLPETPAEWMRLLAEFAPDMVVAYSRGELSPAGLLHFIDQRLSRLTVQYSRHRDVANWLTVLKRLGHEMSDDTFRRRRNGEAKPSYRQNPDSTRSSISLAIADLPAEYSDDL